jgi:protein-disulfide isomerase
MFAQIEDLHVHSMYLTCTQLHICSPILQHGSSTDSIPPMNQANDRRNLTSPVNPRDHLQGSLDAAVVLVEYGDYQCPKCGEAHAIVHELQAQFGARLCYVFRHFPQPYRLQAQKAAEAAEASASQGKFWQMHQLLLTRSPALCDADLVEYAIELDLDVMQFLRELSDHAHTQRIVEDRQSGILSGVNQTPALFINATRYDGDWSVKGLSKAIAQLEQLE